MWLAAQSSSAADKLNTSYISTTPGSSSVLWVAKDAKIFDKHGIDATVIFISGSVRGIQSILAGEIAIGEGGGPGLASARLAGGDVVAIAGNVNVLPYYLVSQPSIKKHEDLRGKIGGTHIAGTTAEFALKVGLKRIGLDPLKDVNLRVIGGAIERMVALQKGIVNFTVVTEAGKAMAERLGYPTVVDMVTLADSFSAERHLHVDEIDAGRIRSSSAATCGLTSKRSTSSRPIRKTRSKSCASIPAWTTAKYSKKLGTGTAKFMPDARIRRRTATSSCFRTWQRKIPKQRKPTSKTTSTRVLSRSWKIRGLLKGCRENRCIRMIWRHQFQSFQRFQPFQPSKRASE